MKEKIFVACFLGALIGALTGINLQIGWFGGGVVGFVVGYITYDFRRVASTTKAVAGEVYEEISNWRPDKQRWIAVTMYLLSSARMGFTIALPLVLWMSLRGAEFGSLLVIALMIPMLFLVMSAAAVEDERSTEELRSMARTIPAQNPIKFWLWTTPKWIIMRAIRILTLIFGVIRRIPRFVVGVLRLIHSDMRLLCATDAAIGAVIGTIFGSPILWALFGGVFGVANYELVSKRWLKLVKE